MRLVLKTFTFHICCILIFSVLYLYSKEHFALKINERFTIYDSFLLSTTIQAGVGISEIYPHTPCGKMLMTLQQLLMIMTNIFTIYIFTL